MVPPMPDDPEHPPRIAVQTLRVIAFCCAIASSIWNARSDLPYSSSARSGFHSALKYLSAGRAALNSLTHGQCSFR